MSVRNKYVVNNRILEKQKQQCHLIFCIQTSLIWLSVSNCWALAAQEVPCSFSGCRLGRIKKWLRKSRNVSICWSNCWFIRVNQQSSDLTQIFNASYWLVIAPNSSLKGNLTNLSFSLSTAQFWIMKGWRSVNKGVCYRAKLERKIAVIWFVLS